ncbi:MAG: hypothetical protein JWM10_5015 [Myxococcaceae bacterium]|nr:hypothetical protein [Myxococcaceae bacterium]
MKKGLRTALVATLLLAAHACTPRLNFDSPRDAAVDAASDATAVDAATVDAADVATPEVGGPDAASTDRPASDAPVADIALVDTPVVDTPAIDTPVVDTPVVDTPPIDIPVIDVVPADVCTPRAAEVCGNAVDDDCDGRVDEGCRVLGAFARCPTAMFASVDLDEDFDSATSYAARWTGSHVAPQVSGGALAFGPHPLTANWWENYSPTSSNRSFGDALLCATFSFTPAASGDGTGTLEVSLRGVSEGMVVSVRGYNRDVVLQTKRADGTWAVHATAPLAFERDVAQTVDVMLLAAGDRFRAEVRNVTTGATVSLRAQYALPAGPVGLLGWMLRNAARVDRVRVGPPSAEVTRVLANPDY